MIPFHKMPQLERGILSDPRLRPIAIGSLLTRFSCRTLLHMIRRGLAERMLRSNQFSFGIPGGVQQIIIGFTIILQWNPDFVLGEFDLRNAHTNCNRGLIWQDLLNDTFSLLDQDLPMYVWRHMHPPMALWERPRPASHEHPLVG